MKKGIVIFLFCSLGVQLVQAQTPVQIASRCAQAVGGRAAWQNVEFVQYAGNMRIDEKKYPIKFYQKMPLNGLIMAVTSFMFRFPPK